MENLILSRQELHGLFWSKPLSHFSAEWQITVPVLRKICLDFGIPLPWAHHWSREQLRNPTPPEPLPVVPGSSESIDLRAAALAASASLLYPGETGADCRVPNKLTEPDRLIVAAEKTLQDDPQLYWTKGMVRAGWGELAVRASKSNMNRALRIMDTLVKCWRKRGYEIGLRDKETVIHIREVTMKVGLRELTKKLPKKGEHDIQHYEATGQLAFKLDAWMNREWRDGKLALEEQVRDILDHMEVTALEVERFRAESEARQLAEAARESAAADSIRNDAEEREAFEALLQEAQRWQQFKVLDSYLDELSRQTPRTPAFQQWLNWARQRRRVFDPGQQRQEKG